MVDPLFFCVKIYEHFVRVLERFVREAGRRSMVC